MKLHSLVAIIATACATTTANASDSNYDNFPITVKGYEGKSKDSVAYTGQVARHVLHNSLKSLSSKGTGKENPELKAQMMLYFSEKSGDRAILSPKSSDAYPLMQMKVDDISSKKNLEGKTYKGVITGWPNNMTGGEMLSFLIDKASETKGGVDLVNGMNYPQLISKTAMGAIFYHQAVDGYLDENLEADKKPNDQPYKKGAAYTGKEHSWDEAFGYFGAPANVLSLDAKTAYNIAKGKEEALKSADFNKDGKIDLRSEMTFAHAYYAADADKSGKTNYLHTISQAFYDGRKILTEAKGEKLTDSQRSALKAQAAIIKSNWEQVIAEAAFKYAGSVYNDLNKLQKLVDSGAELPEISKIYTDYVKHWGEMKGFSLALQMGGKDLGGTSVKMNRLIGFGPVLMGDTQVSGIDSDGDYVQSSAKSMSEYMLHMAKVQKLLAADFNLKAHKNDVIGNIEALNKKLGDKLSAETD